MNKEVIIKVTDLVKKYDELTAVNGVSFEVYKGEIFGLLGPNGAGKTTTLEIMETLRTKTSGSITIDGLSVDNNKEEIKKNIGVQLQQSGFYPGLTLTEILKLFGGLYNVEVDCMEILNLVDLKEKAKFKYTKLSGGQQQRFSIATTLINKPKIIFLDEPTTGLDPQARRNLWELIEKIRKEGTTIVLTTHYMDEAEKLCDRVGIIDKGKIISIDTPDNMIETLLKSGFEPHKQVKKATLEDVFLNFTGKELRDL